MIHKILNFLKSDGLLPTLKFCINSILSKMGRTSTAVCVYKGGGGDRHNNLSIDSPLSVKTFTDFEELKAVNFPRLHYYPVKEWMAEGSVCHILFHGSTPVAFGWLHFHSHKIVNVGTFDMGNNIAWLGPQFVHKNWRGNGFQKLLVELEMRLAPNNISYFITSLNSNNIPSIKTFTKLGFHVGGKVVSKRGVSKINIENCAKNILRVK